eukprot:gene6767-7866_t
MGIKEGDNDDSDGGSPGYRIVVDPEEEEEMEDGAAILISDSSKEHSTQGGDEEEHTVHFSETPLEYSAPDSFIESDNEDLSESDFVSNEIHLAPTNIYERVLNLSNKLRVDAGLMAGSLGPTIPELAVHVGHGQDISKVGYFFTTRGLGYFLGSVSGRFYDRFKNPNLVIAGSVFFMSAALYLVTFVHNIWIVGIIFFFEVSFGFGALLAPLFISALSEKSLQYQYTLVCAVMVCACVPVAFMKPPVPFQEDEETARSLTKNEKRLRIEVVVAVAFFLFFYVGAEAGYGGWIFTYAIRNYSLPEKTAYYLNSFFWTTFTFSRLAGVFISLVLSPINLDIPVTGEATSYMVIGASAGEITIPMLIGIVQNHGGYHLLPYVVLFCLIVSLAIYLFIVIRAKRSRNKDNGIQMESTGFNRTSTIFRQIEKKQSLTLPHHMIVLIATVAAVTSAHSMMENGFRHEEVPAGWTMVESAVEDRITLTFALKLREIDELERMLNEEIANPDSNSYRNYLSRDQVSKMVSPLPEDVNRLVKYLVNNVDATIEKSLDDFVVASMDARMASKMLETSLDRFEHVNSGKQFVRTLGPYSLPSEIADIVDFVGGTVRFPNTPKNKVASPVSVAAGSNAPSVVRVYAGDTSIALLSLLRCSDGSTATSTSSMCSSNPITSIGLTLNSSPFATAAIGSLTCQSCGQFANPLINTLCTNFNGNNGGLPASTVYCVSQEIGGLANFAQLNMTVTTNYQSGASSPASFSTLLSPFLTPQVIQERYNMPMLETSYAPNNLSNSLSTQSVAEFLGQFYSTADLEQFFTMVGLDPRLSSRVQVIGPNNQTNPGGEASLDIQFLMGLAPGFNTTFWSTAGFVNGQEPFLEWITDVLNSDTAPLVHSISYGDDEGSLSVDYMIRINQEFIKAGAIGITIVFSSGDVGLNSNSNPLGQSYPAFPATSPYVLAVGATQFSTQATPACSQKAAGLVSIKCSQIGEIVSSIATGSRITSGGGFSNLFGRPSYQDQYVQDYINTHLSNLPSNFYNQSGRAYPDVAALGHNFLVILGGQIVPVDGTSAAAPTFASVLTLINNDLLSRGKSPIGFANPTIYKVAHDGDTFFDVVMGDNSCPESFPCNQFGFPAVPGWDASTGFGSPNYEKLSRAVDRLPSW